MKPNRNPFQRLWDLSRRRELPPFFSSAVTGNSPEDLAYLRKMEREWQDPTLDLPLAGLEAVVVDLETTGFHPQRGDEILSIGAVVVRGSERLDEERFFSLVQPGRSIPRHIQELTGLTPEALHEAPDLAAALARFFQFVGRRPLVAHHSRHERAFLQAALWKTGRARLVHRLLDTMLLIQLSEGPLGDTSLDALCARHGIAIRRRHDALWDAWATAELWGIYLKRAVERGFRTLHEVYRELGSRGW